MYDDITIPVLRKLSEIILRAFHLEQMKHKISKNCQQFFSYHVLPTFVSSIMEDINLNYHKFSDNVFKPSNLDVIKIFLWFNNTLK